MIKVAIQKSGRLSDDTISLFRECGIRFSRGTGRLKSTATNFPLEFLFLRDDDIPGYVADGVAHLGVVGENVMIEKKKDVILRKKLGFSKCRLSVAIPKGNEYNGPEDLRNKSIATSYPVVLQKWLDEKGLTAELHEISGSVEIAPSIGLAEAVCDIVSTGSTLLSNGLKEVETVMRSEAVLISNKNLDAKQTALLEKLLFRMNAVQTGGSNKYILLNAPNEQLDKIISLLPGMKSPTVLPLHMEGWSSVHSVMAEDDYWEVVEELKNNGAQGILVVPIENMII
ncbi:ATP phosphoribosyltransferase [Roseivirga sp. BDSF3-8]|uniref:ATP phosphoribosyltransferase n=1 Tax=Roseivirga sp. BDSF3-8 TaxID=3241598 RepID=UPI003532097A